MVDRPYTRANRPTAERATDTTSSLIFSGSAMFLMHTAPARASTLTRTAAGTNTLRQPNAVTIRPDTTGANAGPKVIMQLPMDRYVPKRLRGATISTVLIMAGMKMPVPTACARRAASNRGKVGAAMQASDPPTRNTAAAKKSVRRCSRLKRNAVTVTMMAVTTM